MGLRDAPRRSLQRALKLGLPLPPLPTPAPEQRLGTTLCSSGVLVASITIDSNGAVYVACSASVSEQAWAGCPAPLARMALGLAARSRGRNACAP